jgi:hypothetical protein
MLILVTGSRDWTAYEVVRKALIDQVDDWKCDFSDVLLIHGDAPGADRMSETAARGLGMRYKVMPANWNRYGPAAGRIRNNKMLDLNPHVVLAFPLPQSKGTVHCMNEAVKRGIPVKVFKP